MQSILPQNTQLTLVFGSPIPVEKKEQPTDEDINRIHKQVGLKSEWDT